MAVDDDLYWGAFIRVYPSQIPNWSGSGGLWTQCPDIANGGSSQLDPNQLLAHYRKPLTPAPFGLNQANYVYVTSENSYDQNMTVRVWVFWVVQRTCLWPTTWQSQGITVGGQAVNYQSLSLQAADPWPDHKEKPVPGPPAVTATPFVITPSVQAPSQDQFSLVTIVENEPSHPAKPPLPDPFGTMTDLATWVSVNGNVGWLNMTLPN